MDMMEVEKSINHIGACKPQEDKERLWRSREKLNEDTWPKLLKSIEQSKTSANFSNATFDAWRRNSSPRVICIQGEDGMGKTTMMIALIEYLQDEVLTKFKIGQVIISQLGREKAKPNLLSYFFCQRHDARRNNVVDVLKSLISQLLSQCRKLKLPVVVSPRIIPQGPNAFYILRTILGEILQHKSLNKVYLLVDALDECEFGLPQLLDIIADQRYKATWLVTASRAVDVKGLDMPLSLTSSEISNNVSSLIRTSIKDVLPESDVATRNTTRDSLVKADVSYLWIDLAFNALENKRLQNSELPSSKDDLTLLYEILKQKIIGLITKAGSPKTPKETLFEVMEEFFYWTTLSYNPLHLDALNVIMANRKAYPGVKGLEELIGMWKPLLYIDNDIIFFRHQSIRKYIEKHVMGNLAPSPSSGNNKPPGGHWSCMLRCLELMQEGLVKDATDSLASTANHGTEKPNQNALRPGVEYACYYWIGHLVDALDEPKEKGVPVADDFLLDGGELHDFLKAILAHWLVTLFMLDRGADSIPKLTTLASKLPAVNASKMHQLIHDTKRLVLENQKILEEDPLQLYSFVLFSPKTNVLKDKIQKDSGVRVITTAPKDCWNPLLHTLEGHTNWVKTVTFSPNGEFVASGSDDGTIRLWDTESGVECARLPHSSSVYGITFADKGEHIVSISGDHTIKFWKTVTGSEDMGFSNFRAGETSTNSIAFSWERKLIAYASNKYEIKICSESGPEIVSLEGHTSYISAVVWSPHEHKLLLASASGDETVRIWNIPGSDGQYEDGVKPLKTTLDLHSDPVNSVVFSPVDENILASGSDDHTIIIWDLGLKDNEQARSRLCGHTGPVNSVAFSLDGQLVASGSDDGTVRLWNVKLGIPYGILEGHSSWVRAVSFSSNGQLASASDDQTVKIWDVEMGKAQRARNQHSDYVTTVAFSPQLSPPAQSQNWYASASYDKTVKLWDTETGEPFATLEGHLDIINCVVFSQDGGLIASASDDQTINSWNTESLRQAREDTGSVAREADFIFEGHQGRLTCIAFSPDSKFIISSSSDENVMLWDIERVRNQNKDKELQKLNKDKTDMPQEVEKDENKDKGKIIIKHEETVRMVAVSLDAASGDLLIASASNDKEVGLWRLPKGAEISTASEAIKLTGHNDWVRAIAFSHNGAQLASGSDDGKVKVWTTAIVQSACFTLTGHTDWIKSLAFSSNDKLLVSGSDDSRIRLWDTSNWDKEAIVLVGHDRAVNSIAISPPDNKLIVSASSDMTVRIWDIQSRTGSILGKHSDRVSRAVFSPDGYKIVSASDDKTVKLWDTDKRQLFAAPDHSRPITQIEFSKNLIATISGQKDIRLWDLTAKLQRTLIGHSGNVNCISFSEDGELLASGSDDKSVMVWSRMTGQRTWTLLLPGRVNLVTFLGDKIATAYRESAGEGYVYKVSLWEVGKEVLYLTSESHTRPITAVDILLSKKLPVVATASEDNKIRIWYEETTGNPEVLDADGPIKKLHFSQDSSYLITNRGCIRTARLPSAKPGTNPPLDPTSKLYVEQKWVTRDVTKTKIFAIPDEYQPTQVCVHNEVVILGHKSGTISILTFDLSKISELGSQGYGFSRAISSKSSESGSSGGRRSETRG